MLVVSRRQKATSHSPFAPSPFRFPDCKQQQQQQRRFRTMEGEILSDFVGQSDGNVLNDDSDSGDVQMAPLDGSLDESGSIDSPSGDVQMAPLDGEASHESGSIDSQSDSPSANVGTRDATSTDNFGGATSSPYVNGDSWSFNGTTAAFSIVGITPHDATLESDHENGFRQQPVDDPLIMTASAVVAKPSTTRKRQRKSLAPKKVPQDVPRIIVPRDDHSREKSDSEEIPFKCLQCGVSCKTLTDLKNHVKTHPIAIKTFPCPVCSTELKTEATLKAHMVTHSSTRPYKCLQCGLAYKRPNALKLHMEMHASEGGYKCNICDCGYKKRKDYAKHMKVYHDLFVETTEDDVSDTEDNAQPEEHEQMSVRVDNPGVKCLECEKVFTTVDHLSLHEASVHGDGTEYDCDECDVSFITQAALDKHVEEDHHKDNVSFAVPKSTEGDVSVKEEFDDSDYEGGERQRKHVCEICDKRFVKAQHLREHLDSHTDSTYKCEHCDKEFKSKRGRDRHKRMECEEELYRFKCLHPRCDRGFPSLDEMMMHKLVHNKTCAECGKTFELRRRYLEHIVSHTDARPYECGDCGLTFKTKSALNSHSEKHSDHPRFKCSLCDKVFRLKCHLKDHSRVHTADRPFECEQCPKKFKSAKCLKAHSQKMHREDTVTCDICKAKLESKDLEQHLLTHSKYQCAFCHKNLSSAASFTYHEKVSCPVLHGYRCYNCQQIFPTDAELAIHKKNHVIRDNKCIEKGMYDKRFPCHLCDTSFHRKNHLEDHVIVVHKKIKRFHCDHCGESFLHRTSHQKHVAECGKVVVPAIEPAIEPAIVETEKVSESHSTQF